MRDDRALAAMPPRKYSSMALRQNDDFSSTHGATKRFTSFRFPYVKKHRNKYNSYLFKKEVGFCQHIRVQKKLQSVATWN